VFERVRERLSMGLLERYETSFADFNFSLLYSGHTVCNTHIDIDIDLSW